MAKQRNYELLAVAAATLFAAPALAADLVHHHGFETCWSPALDKAQFLTAMRTSIDGRTGCIPPQSGNQSGVPYTVCNVTNGCGSGVPGCVVGLQAGVFSGDFVAGSFVAPGSASTIAAPLDAGIFGSCTVNITAITLTYTLDYLMRTDGSDGVYTDDLLRPLVDIVSYASNNNCNALIGAALASYLPQAIASAEAGAAAAIDPVLRTNTLERAICPLSVP